MASKKSMPQVHGRRTSLLSCFRRSKVQDSDDIESPVSKPSSGRKGLWFSWRKLLAKNKTVTVDAPSTEMGDGASEDSRQNISSKKAGKDKISKWLRKIHHHKNQRQREAPNEAKPRCFLAARYSTRRQPAPLICVRDQACTGKRTVHLALPDAFRAPSRKPSKKCAETTRLSVLALALVMTTLFGRAFAIVCVCAWFYLLPRLRTAVAAVTRVDAGAMKSEINVTSEEEEKRVVIEGLLERKSKPPGSVDGSSGTSTQ